MINILRKGFILTLALLNVFLLVACNSNVQGEEIVGDKATSISPETITLKGDEFESILIRNHEPDMRADLYQNMDCITIGSVTYGFDPKISLEDREGCINTTQKILANINFEGELEIYIYPTERYDASFIYPGKIMTFNRKWNIEAFEDQEYIITLLYGVFGPFSNYGLLFGYSEILSNELFGTNYDSRNLEGSLAKDGNITKDWIYVDLDLLCFNSAFAEEKDIDFSKKISRNLVEGIIKSQGVERLQEIIVSSGNIENKEKFDHYMTEFYRFFGIDYIPTNFLFCYGGKVYRYGVKN